MSRSRKNTPVTGITTARSEAEDKRIWHKRARAMMRARLLEPDPAPVIDIEASSDWLMSKDGKRYWGGTDFEPQAVRK